MIHAKKYLQPLYSLSLRMMTVISSFLFSWIVARIFGAENSGVLFFYITIITIVVTLSSQGADLGIAKAAARINNDRKENLSGIFKYVFHKSRLIYLFFTPVLLAYIIYDGHGVIRTAFLFFLVFVIGYCFLYMNILSYFYQGVGNVLMMILSQRTIFNFISFALIAILWGYCYWYKLDSLVLNIDFQMTIIALSAIITFVFFVFYYKNTSVHTKIKHKPNGFDNSCKELFKIQTMQLITMYGSQVIINFFATKSDIAGFIISQRISTLLGFFVLAVSSVISSKVSRAYSVKDFVSVKSNAYQSFLFSSTLGIPVAILLIFFSERFLSFFGADFIQFSSVLIILVCSQIINCLTGACDIVLMFIDGEREHKRNVVIGTFVALFLSLILIPLYEAVGAAIATAVSAIIVNILDVVSIRKKAGFWIFKLN